MIDRSVSVVCFFIVSLLFAPIIVQQPSRAPVMPIISDAACSNIPAPVYDRIDVISNVLLTLPGWLIAVFEAANETLSR